MAVLSQCLIWVALSASAPAATAKPAAQVDPAAANAAFWQDVSAEAKSPAFRELESRASPVSLVTGAVAAGREANVQPVANVAVESPAQAASIIRAATDRKLGADTRAALSTVALLRTTQDQRAAAVRDLPAPQRAEATSFNANLSSGIRGLPGIYLDSAPLARSPAPVGYSAVPGQSVGCPSR